MSEVGRGWGRVLVLALATMLLSVVQPALLIFVPFALLAVALPPWRPLALALAGLILWLTFGGGIEERTMWYFERGWTLLLGSWFVLMVVVLPGRGFLPRALAAVFAAAATVGGFVAVNRSGWVELDAAVNAQMQRLAQDTVALYTRMFGDDPVVGRMAEATTALAEFHAKLFPAMLALASLAALAVAWWAFGRLARDERTPLGPLREFRFADGMVWLLIAGIILLGLPLNTVATRIGENLLTFTAVLYALRGAAVLVMIGGVPGPLGLLLGSLLILFLAPYVMATTFVVGLSDTWLDIRARRQKPPAPGS